MTVEEIVIGYLSGADIAGIGGNVYAEKPLGDVRDYLLVSRSGGSERNFIRRYLVHTDVHVKRDEEDGGTKSRALAIHEAVTDAMRHLADTCPVYGCHKESDYEATMPGTKEYRYQALWVITM